MPSFTLTAAVLGTPDPRGLARFYQRLLGWPIRDDEPPNGRPCGPADGSTGLSFQLETEHVPPVWPPVPGTQQMQQHLDILVDDLRGGRRGRRGGRSRVPGRPRGRRRDRARLPRPGRPPLLPVRASLNPVAARAARVPSLAPVADLPATARWPHRPTARRRRRRARSPRCWPRPSRWTTPASTPSAEDLTEWWTGWTRRPRRGRRRRLRRRRVVVGLGDGDRPAHLPRALRVDLEGRVHPGWRGRGIGRALLAWQLARGAEVHAERHPEVPADLSVAACTSMTSLEALLRRAGLTAGALVRRDGAPAGRPAGAAPVPGVELVPFTWDRDDEVRRAHNAAFTEHHGSAERDAADLAHLVHRSARASGRTSRCSPSRTAPSSVTSSPTSSRPTPPPPACGRPTSGRSASLPAARGRGLAKATIAAALRAAAEGGCRRAGLQVDSENVTGALGLYEGLGFTARRDAGLVVPNPGGAGVARRSVGSAHGQRRSARSVSTREWWRARTARSSRCTRTSTSPPSTTSTSAALGLRPGRMGYFAGRAAPMGAVGAGRGDGDLLQLLAVARGAHDPAGLDAGLARAGPRRPAATPPGRR